MLRSLALLLATLTSVTQASALTVSTNADSGAGSLRQAIADATSGSTITFDAALNGAVISLTSGHLQFDKNLTIQGPGPQLLAVNGNGTSRIFLIENTAANSTRSVAISGLTITNGVTTSGGGGIRTSAAYTKNVVLVVSNCVIRANRASGTSYEGGGGVASVRYTTLTMRDCDVSGNTAPSNGGGGVWAAGPSIFERVAFVGNTTPASGGGLLVRSGETVSIRNCTFSGNSSTYNDWNDAAIGGGALYTQEGGNVAIYNTTVTANSAARRCGGIRSQGTTTMVLHSVISAGNSDTRGYPDVQGIFTGVTNCLIQVTNGVSIAGANNIFNQSAQLEALASNGGPTRTHALKKISQAIDHGYNPLALATDQRGTGYPRLLGAAVDIGAYEYFPPPSATLILLR